MFSQYYSLTRIPMSSEERENTVMDLSTKSSHDKVKPHRSVQLYKASSHLLAILIIVIKK